MDGLIVSTKCTPSNLEANSAFPHSKTWTPRHSIPALTQGNKSLNIFLVALTSNIIQQGKCHVQIHQLAIIRVMSKALTHKPFAGLPKLWDWGGGSRKTPRHFH